MALIDKNAGTYIVDRDGVLRKGSNALATNIEFPFDLISYDLNMCKLINSLEELRATLKSVKVQLGSNFDVDETIAAATSKHEPKTFNHGAEKVWDSQAKDLNFM